MKVDHAELRRLAEAAMNDTPDMHLLGAKYELGERGEVVLALLKENERLQRELDEAREVALDMLDIISARVRANP